MRKWTAAELAGAIFLSVSVAARGQIGENPVYLEEQAFITGLVGTVQSIRTEAGTATIRLRMKYGPARILYIEPDKPIFGIQGEPLDPSVIARGDRLLVYLDEAISAPEVPSRNIIRAIVNPTYEEGLYQGAWYTEGLWDGG